ILQHQYGVDLTTITWVLSGDEHVAEYQSPSNVTSIGPHETLEELLTAGEIAAAIGIQAETPNVQPLIPNADEAGFEALRDRGLYPINHTVVVRNDLLAADPNLSEDIFDAFVAAKRIYVQRLAESRIDDLSLGDRFYSRVMEITGDPLPYGVE